MIFYSTLHQLGPQYLISPCCSFDLCLLRSPYLLFHPGSLTFEPVYTLIQATWVNMIQGSGLVPFAVIRDRIRK